ncbi:hypothetical protein ASC89_05780 [Devosia sp. Root413D1]|nr:hypothetical protein ASC89_05780 [Devosia sp. Root413D1]
MGVEDLAARVLVLCCALNLNGLFSMIWDVEQAISVVVLAAAVLLVIQRGRTTYSAPFALVVAGIASYLIFAGVVTSPEYTDAASNRYYFSYLASILIIWAAASYICSIQNEHELLRFIAFARNAFVVAAASVWFSPLLYQIYVNLPPSADSRSGGFFGNPNEAATAAILALLLTINVPFARRTLQFAVLAVCCVAVFMTFSKTGMVVAIAVIAMTFIKYAKHNWYFLVISAAALILLVLQDIGWIVQALADQTLLELDDSQRRRLQAVVETLSGRIDAETSTGRTVIWSLVGERIWQAFPFGTGLGSGHEVVGGVMQYGKWQGAHNTFLMMLAEAGIIPPLLLALGIGTAFLRGARRGVGSLEFLMILVLLVDMMVTHGALATRYHNLALAMAMGLLSRPVLSRREPDTSWSPAGRKHAMAAR